MSDSVRWMASHSGNLRSTGRSRQNRGQANRCSYLVDELTGDHLSTLLNEVLSNSTYQDNSRKLQKAIVEANGLSVAADQIERSLGLTEKADKGVKRSRSILGNSPDPFEELSVFERWALQRSADQASSDD